MTNTAGLTAAIVIVIVILVIIAMISFNWILTYYMLMKAKVYEIEERLPYSAMVAGFLNTMFIFFGLPFQWLVTLNVINENASINPTYYAVFITSVILFNIPSSLVVLGRTIQIVFKLKYYESIDKQSWTKFIDNKAYKNSFWIKYFNIFYTRNTIYYILGAYYLCTATPFLYLTIKNKRSTSGNPANGAELGLLFGASAPTTILLIILTCIFPKYQDSIGLRVETIKVTIVYVANVALSGLCSFVIKDVVLFMIAQSIFGGPGWLLWLYFLFAQVLRIYRLPLIFTQVKVYKRSLHREFSVSTTGGSSHTTANELTMGIHLSDRGSNAEYRKKISDEAKKKKFTDFLVYPNMLNKFALHLITEFAIENLLFIYELQQFKIKLEDVFEINKKIINFSPDVPESPIALTIINDANEINSKIDAFISLCVKYIFDNAKFQVNISFQSRNHINKIFKIDSVYFNASNLDKNRDKYSEILKEYINNNNDNITIQSMDKIFHESAKEILQLISYSWNAFKRDDHFEEYLTEIVST